MLLLRTVTPKDALMQKFSYISYSVCVPINERARML